MRLFLALLFLLSAMDAHAESTAGAMFIQSPDGSYEVEEGLTIKLPTKDCVIVYFAEESGPLYKAGVRPDDVITHVGGEPIDSIEAAQKAFRSAEPGKVISVAYQRPFARAKTSNVTWRRRAAKVKPVDYGEYLLSIITSEDNIASESTHYKFKTDEEGLPKSSQIEPGVIKAGSSVYPALTITHVGNLKWLFAKKLTFIDAGDERTEIDPGKWRRDNTHKHTWEWCLVTGEEGSPERKMFEALADGRLIKVLLHGDDYFEEYNTKVYEAYKAGLMRDYMRVVLKQK